MAQSSLTIGRVTADLELKKSERGNLYVRFNIAERIGYGHYTKTQFSQIWARGEDAESLIKGKVKKGSPIWVSGPLELEEYQRQDGSKDKRLKIELKEWGYVPGNNLKKPDTENNTLENVAELVIPPNEIDGDRKELPD